jgi:para-nitrobenzyl esterase
MQENLLLMRFMTPDPSGSMSEDCLYLNVWRPRKSGRLPVVVFLHGGGYGLMSANHAMFRPDRLAARAQVIVVMPNYRLGALGFLALPELREESVHASTGSYGMLDQLAALRWVQENVESFGGDPDNVTVMGESAGGWSVAALLASPRAAGLFHRAVMMSGGPHVSDLPAGFARGGALAGRLGCRPEDLRCLRSADASDVVDAQDPTTFVRFSFGPHIDGHVLEQHPQEAFRSGRFNRVPLIAGTTRDEMRGNLAGNDEPVADAAPGAYVAGLAALFAVDERAAGEVAEHYPLEAYQGSPYLAAGMAVTELGFTCPTFDMVDAIARRSPELWLYRFDVTSYRKGADWGAAHGLDVPFLFDGFDRSPYKYLYNDEQRARAAPLTRELQLRLAAFARGAAPDASNAVPWPRFQREAPRLLRLAEGDRVIPADLTERCAFWSAHPYTTRW